MLQGQEAGNVQILKSRPKNSEFHWDLGIDIGTTGISAVLLQRDSGQVYPVYWDENRGEAVRKFRLPAVLSPTTDERRRGVNPDWKSDRRWALPLSVESASPAFNSPAANVPRLLIQDFKPWLKLGIPHRSPQTQQWQPVLQWSDVDIVPLHWIQQGLQTLLATLKPVATITATTTASLTCGAVGLTTAEFSSAIDRLSAVIVGYPANWSDTYSFNLREAVLGAGLVDHPEQVFLIEDTIAALLSLLRQEAQEPEATNNPALPAHPSSPLQTNVVLQNADWQGTTLILNAGATVTELALVNLPDQLQDLQYSDFHIRSLPFAGNAIDQDIVCHLLYPLLKQTGSTPAAVTDRADLSLDAVRLADLGLEQLPLPAIGELDLPNRYRLQQRLESLQTGQILLSAARSLKLAFYQQSRFTLQVGDRHITILRQDLGSRILLPYVQRLNRELNSLLQQTSTAVESVEQVICTGGTASIRAIGRWLHEKFPNATIIQDAYTAQPDAHCLSSCSRVAYGLAALPLHAQVLDRTHHQHNDYFLLLTLLQILPDRPVTFGEIAQRLVQEGVDMNSERCQLHLLALLDGHLPPGLIPTESESLLFAAPSRNGNEFAGIWGTPLCQKQGDYWRPNLHQRDHLQRLLTNILHTAHQHLEAPYSDRQISEVERSSYAN